MRGNCLKGKRAWSRNVIALAVASCFAGELAYANPTAPTVTRGSATFATQGNVLTVTNAPGTVINWQSFSIASQEITKFLQQSSASAVLNRVVGVNPSAILGQLQSNGRVYLINPNGIGIGPHATIDVAGFVASTLNISDGDFIAGRHRFNETPGAGSVINQGKITTPAGGMVYLVGQNVENHGIIKTPGGEIMLAAGKSIELVDAQTPEVRVQITASDGQALNLGQLIASGGRIGMYAGLVRHGGTANANTAVVGENGKIVFKAVKDVTLEKGSVTTASGPSAGSIKVEAQTGTATVAGTVEANATAARGGTIEVVAAQGVTIEPTARVSADGIEGGRIAFNSATDAVRVSGRVSADASAGRGGEVAIAAATQAVIAAGARVSASGTQGGGSVEIKASGSGAAPAVPADGAVAVVEAAEPGSVDVSGTVAAEGGAAQGGAITLNARSNATLGDTGVLSAIGSAGGAVHIEAREGTTLASGIVDASGKRGHGGKVLLLGPRVGLLRNARLDVSGLTGGGLALIGGDFQGNNAAIQNAWRTYFGPDAVVTADAIQTGDGGKVIVWSDDVTRFYGRISVRGGAQGGNGGFVETSGKHSLDFKGSVDLAAPGGKAGNLLLDPTDITVVAAGGTLDAQLTPPGDLSILFGDGAANTTLSVAELTAFTTGTITLEATNNIDFQVPVTLQDGVNLVARAGNDVSLTGTGTLAAQTTGAITLTADANFSGSGGPASNNVGAITRTAAANTITLASGALTLNAASGITANTAASTVSFSNTSTGNVSIANARAGGVSFSGTNGAPGGTIALSETLGNLTVGGVISTTANAAGNTGGITLATTAGDITFNASVTTGNATLAGTAGADSVSSGTIQVTAGGNGNVLGASSIVAGSATITGGVAGDTATVGNISLSGNRIAQAGSGTNPLAVSFGAASAGALGTSNAGMLTAASDGVGGAGDIRITSGAALVTGTVTAADAGAAVSIATTGGNAITSKGTITGPGGVTINAGTGTFTNFAATGAVTTGAAVSTITITADGIDLQAASSISGAGALTLQPSTAGTDIGLAGGAGAFNLTGAELGTLTNGFTSITIGAATGAASGAITFGDGAGGGFTFSDNVTLANGAFNINVNGPLSVGANTLSLTTGAAIADGNAAGNDLTATSLALRAATGIGAGNALETAVTNLAFNNSGANGVTLSNTGALTIAAVDGLTSSSGGSGATTITAASPITIAVDNIQAGSISYTAGETAAATDHVTVNDGVTVRSTGGSVTLQAGDNVVLGNTNGAGTLVKSNSGGVTLTAGFGNTDATGNAVLNRAQVQAGTSVALGAFGSIAQDALGEISGASLSTTSTTGVSLPGTANAVAAATFNNTLSGGVSFVNAANLTLNVTAAGGALSVNNTGTLATGSIIPATSVSLTSSDNMTIAHDVTASTAAGVNLTVTGAGKTLTQSAGTITSLLAGPINLTADDMALNGTAIGTVGVGNGVTLTSFDAARAINVGSGTGGLDLSGTELSKIITTGALTIGGATHTGTINVDGVVNPATALGGIALTNGGNISVNATANLTSATTLTLTADNALNTATVGGGGRMNATSLTVTADAGINLTGANTVQTVGLTNSTTGDIVYTGSNVGALNALTITGANNATGGAFTVAETTGNLLVGGANLTTEGGQVSLTTQKAGGLITLVGNVNTTAGGSTAGADVTLRGDALTLTGTVNAGTAGGVTLRPNDLTAVIGVEDSTQTFNVTNTKLNQLTAGGTITIGATTHTGAISAAGNAAISQTERIALVTDGSINFGGTTANGITAGALSLTAGANGNNAGAITQAATNTGRLATSAGDLALSARGGIGDIAPPADAPVRIGTVAGGSLAANNANNGDLFLDLNAATFNVGGASGITQFSGGALRIDSSGNLVVTGNLSAGTGSVTLNPTGTLTRTGGTVTANVINLGTNGNATTIGATGAGRIRVAHSGGAVSPAVAAHATTGGIFLQQESGNLATGSYALNVAAGTPQAIELATTNGNITINHNYTTHWNANTQNDNVTLIAQGATPAKNIVGGTPLITSGNITLNASGGIGTGTPVNTNSVAGAITLTTAGANAEGNISLVEANALNTNRVTINTNSTGGSDVQSVSLTSTAGPITLGDDIGTLTDNLTLIASAGNIVGGAGNTATAANLTLNAAGGIGIGTPVNTETTGTLTLTSAGANALGNVTVVEANALDTSRVVLNPVGAGAQSVSLTSTAAGGITVGGNIGNTTDDLTLIATAGNIEGGAGTAQANNLTLDASGGIGTGVAVNTNTTGTLDLTSAGAGPTGNISVVEVNALNVSRVDFATNGGGTQTVSLSGSSITVDTAFGVASDNLTLIARTGSIGGGAIVTANNLRLDGAQGVGTAGTPLLTNVVGNLAAQLTSAGAGGAIVIEEVAAGTTLTVGTANGLSGITTLNNRPVDIRTGNGALNINQAIAAGTGQVDLRAQGGAGANVALGANVTGGTANIVAADAVTHSAGTVSATGLLLDAVNAIGTGIGAASVHTDVTTLAARTSSTATGDIFVTEANNVAIGTVSAVPGVTAKNGGSIDIRTTSGDITLTNNVRAEDAAGAGGTGNVTLIAGGGAGNDLIAGAGRVTTGSGTVDLRGDAVGTLAAPILTDIGAGSLTATSGAGNIAVSNNTAGGLNTIQLTGFTTGGGVQTVRVTQTAGDITVGGNVGVGGDTLELVTPGGNIVGGLGTLTAGALRLDANGGIGTGTAVKTATTGTLTLSSAGANALGNVTVVEANALDTSRVALNTAGAGAQTVSLTSTAAGGITVGGAIGTGTDDLTLIATAGNIEGGAGTAQANNLTLDASGGIGTGVAVNTNTTGTLDLTSAGAGPTGNISVVEVNALNVSRVDFATNGGGTQTVSLSGSSITVDTAFGVASDNLTLIARTGSIGGGAIVTANNLRLDGAQGVGTAGTPLLTNVVGNLAAQLTSAGAGGAIVISEVAAGGTLTIGTANGLDGVAATNNRTINLQTQGGTLNLTQYVNAGAGDVLLVSSANIAQSGGAITAGDLGARAATGISLTQSANAVANFAAANSGAGTVAYRDTNGFQVGSVGGFGTFTAASGIATRGLAGDDVLLQAGGGALSLTQNVNAGAADVRLISGANIAQTGGIITANRLGARAATGISLPQANAVSTFAALNSTSGAITYHSAGPLTIDEVLAQTIDNITFNTTTGIDNLGTTVTVTAADGGITTSEAIRSVTGVTVVANDTAGTNAGTLNVGAGIEATGTAAPVVLKSAQGMVIGGTVSTNEGAITLVAGSAPGMASLLPITPATNNGDTTIGTVEVKAPILAGMTPGGSVTIYTTGAVTQDGPSSIAGIQSNALTVRTYNDVAGAATITLENDRPITGNSSNLLVPLETRMANDTGTGLEDNFQASEIRYKSISGTAIVGIGTASNVFLEADSWTSLGTVNGRNVNIVATGISGGGNITLNTLVPTNLINGNQPGGSLNLRAVRNITLNGLASIGSAAAPFDHGIILAAGGDITVEAPIYLTGDLNLRARALSADLFGHTPVLAPGGGNVTVSTPVGSAVPVEIRARNIVIGDALRPVNDVILTAGDGATGQDRSVSLITPGSLSMNLLGNLSMSAGTANATSAGAATPADAILQGGNVSITVGGDLNLTGGTANVTGGAGAVQSASALTSIHGGAVGLTVLGNASLKAGGNRLGTPPGGACAGATNGACAATGGNTAITSVVIVSDTSLSASIAGDLTIEGGMATATPGGGQAASAEAVAGLQTAGNLNLNVGGDLSLLGGRAQAASGGTSATATATALLDTQGTNKITVGGDVAVIGGTAAASGPGGYATTRAGTTPGKGGGLTLDLIAGGKVILMGGHKSGNSYADATFLSSGQMKIATAGLEIVGGQGTIQLGNVNQPAIPGLFQILGTSTLFDVKGLPYPIDISGPITITVNDTLAPALMLSGAPPLNLDPLLAESLKALDCAVFSGGACVIKFSAADPGAEASKGQSLGVCK